MKPDAAIQVYELTKVYKLYNAPIDRLKEAIHPFSKRKYHKDFYALNGVSFEVKKGECIGILGKNGAGKSTLLKILTGVLTQSSGLVEVKGKVSALLELGAGFNPEYTGMENIYFQGNVMGYSNEEITIKVPNILEFADIGEFIHQPVKHYSSGMFARLAFSVAINVEPDILIVDEALSVGDAMFQNKCIRKMTEIMGQGATVLFVSHDTQAINKFCTRAIWLRDGKKYMDGETQDVTNAYMSFSSYGLETIIIEDKATKEESILNSNDPILSIQKNNLLIKSKFGTGEVEFLNAGFYNQYNELISEIIHGTVVKFRCSVKVLTRDIHDIAGGFTFVDRLNNDLMTLNSYMYDNPLGHVKQGAEFYFEFTFEMPKIQPGEYTIDIAMAEGTQQNHIQLCWINAAMNIQILSNDFIDCGSFYTVPKGSVNIDYKFL